MSYISTCGNARASRSAVSLLCPMRSADPRDGGIAPQFHREEQVLDLPCPRHKALGPEFSVSVMIAAENGPIGLRPYSCASQRYRRKWDREILWGGRRGNGNFVAACNRWSAAMPQPNDLSRSLVSLDQQTTVIAVVELSQSSWLIGGIVPGIERQPHKKLEPSPERLLAVLHRWRDEAVGAGRTITRIALAFEAGRDGFWLARWLEARGVEIGRASGR